MTRPHLEFIQCQSLPWLTPPDFGLDQDSALRVLSVDHATGAKSFLLRLAKGTARSGFSPAPAAFEFFVLEGGFEAGGQIFGLHDYGFWPPGFAPEGPFAAPQGALLLVFTGNDPGLPGAGPPPEDLIFRLPSLEMVWDDGNIDPNVNFLHMARKNLRLAPDGSCRTYLLGGRPHGMPKGMTSPLERHPHDEEMFLISGDLATSCGVMRAGAYFYRPPGLWHGLNCSVTGFLALLRTPGVNVIQSEWDGGTHRVEIAPAYRPVLPAGWDEAHARAHAYDGPLPAY